MLETLAGWRATLRASLHDLFAPAATRPLSTRAQQLERSAPTATAPIWRALPWRAIITQATAMWLVIRLIYAAFTYFAILFVAQGGPVDPARVFTTVTPQVLMNAWKEWDGVWYVHIAAYGYTTWQPTAFYPFYPLLIHLVMLVLGPGSGVLSALIVANLSGLGACVAVAALAYNEEGDEETAWRTLRLTIAYPLAFFLAAPYTESLFLALAMATLLCARRGAWRWVAFWAFLAGLTRITAVILILPILWEYGRQQGWWLRATWYVPNHTQQALKLLGDLAQPRNLLNFGLAIIATPLAIVLYGVYVWRLFGHPLLLFNVQRDYWNHQPLPLWTSIPLALRLFLATHARSYVQSHVLMDLAPLVVCAVLTAVGARKLPLSFTLYMVGLLYLCVSTPLIDSPDPYGSAGRYLLVSVPLFLLLARWSAHRPWLETLLISAGFLLQAIFLATYLTGGVVT